MASIERRARSDGTTAWRVNWRDPDSRTKQSLTFDDEDKAQRARKLLDANGQRLADASRVMTAIEKQVPTVADIAERHIASLSGITARTRADYRRQAANHITPTLGAFPISAVDAEQVRGWVNALHENGMSGKTLRNVHGLASAVFTYAAAKGLRSDNPCKGVRLPAYRPTEMVFLEPGEFALLLSHIRPEHQLLVQTLAGTGMRWGEACALLPADLDLRSPQPTVRISKAWKRTDSGYEIGPPKTRKAVRTISLPDSLVDPLQARLEHTAAGAPVFPNTTGGYLYRPMWWEHVWVPAVRSAQATHDAAGEAIPEHRRLCKTPRVHDLRHSHVAWLVAAGVDLPTVQHRLGHESITITWDRYGHLMADQLNKAAQAADGALNAVL